MFVFDRQMENLDIIVEHRLPKDLLIILIGASVGDKLAQSNIIGYAIVYLLFGKMEKLSYHKILNQPRNIENYTHKICLTMKETKS